MTALAELPTALDLSRLSCLGEALADAMVPFKSNVALIEVDRDQQRRRLSYADLRREAEAFGALLQSRGFAAGDRCAIIMSNQCRWLSSALGALWSGAILVPLDFKIEPEEQLALLQHAKPRALVVEYPVWRRLMAAGAATAAGGCPGCVFVSEAPEDADVAGAVPIDTAADKPLTPMPRQRDEVACIVYSSGTGGTPKGCMLTHGAYLEQAQILGNLFPMSEGERFFSILPTHHAIDFMCGFVVPLLFGATIVYQRTLRPQFLGSTMKTYRITHMASVPMVLEALEQRIRDAIEALPQWKRMALDALISANETATRSGPRVELSRRLLKPIHDQLGGRLRLMVCGGAFVDRKSAEFFYRLGIPVAIGYGLTEACTVVTVNDLAPFRGDTVGRPVSGVEVELRNTDATGVGEVWVRGKTVMVGYLDEPELTAETLVDGWLRTGDLGSFDASGHLKLIGRQGNMIVTAGGKNIYPEGIEAAFDGLDDCREHCVFAAHYLWPDEARTEDLLIVVRPEHAEPSPQLLADLLVRNRGLLAYKRLRSYVAWHREFPRTGSLKVKRQRLAEAVRQTTCPADAIALDPGAM